MDVFAQTLPGTLSTTAKLSSLTLLSTRNVHVSDRKRNTTGSTRELSLLYQLTYDMNQAGRSKTRMGKGIPACKRHSRTLSFMSRAATAAAQQESHHADLHGCLTSMPASIPMEWNVPQA